MRCSLKLRSLAPTPVTMPTVEPTPKLVAPSAEAKENPDGGAAATCESDVWATAKDIEPLPQKKRPRHAPQENQHSESVTKLGAIGSTIRRFLRASSVLELP